jgi:dipeptidyl aminopeptidase/acylaminoacyl peptidase
VQKSLKDGSETVIGPQAATAHASVVWDEHAEAPVAIVTGPDSTEWLDPQLKAVEAMLAHAFKGKTVTIEGWSSDRSRVVVKVDAGDAPPVWYFYDGARKEVSPIQEAYPALKGVAFGPKSFFTYKAADGLEIPAYVTLPPGGPAMGGKLPLILLPHGGPAAHDGPGFDDLAQFLASRGYAVLQPEFRGSTGFGDALFKAGHLQWGAKMQSDLTDGVKALADKGVIDPSRVCIVGWSYGGYAALAGAALTPNAYKCAVSINGVSDLLTLTGNEVSNFGFGSDASYDIKQEIGDPASDGGRMDAVSPARHADRIAVPILLVGGLDDTTVPYKQTDEMYQALQHAGADVKLVTFKGDDHYLHNPADRVAMLQAVEDFLAKNLPVK